jgi:hypothetical protein
MAELKFGPTYSTEVRPYDRRQPTQHHPNLTQRHPNLTQRHPNLTQPHPTPPNVYPTLPSRLMLSSFCASTANSMGSSRNTSLQKPLTIMFTASSVEMPR